ncbi:MAG: hypothetical protein AAFY70_18560, partial [Bacteroidota bacterium]
RPLAFSYAVSAYFHRFFFIQENLGTLSPTASYIFAHLKFRIPFPHKIYKDEVGKMIFLPSPS